MTRLINADALTEWLEILPNSTYKDTVMNAVDDMPTIDAIPVDFIKSEIARMKEYDSECHPECASYAEELEVLLSEWEIISKYRKEKEG